MVQIAATLDRARALNGLRSDYKLALVMGVNQTSLANYRNNKTLPDVRVLSKLCELTGDDPHLLTAQVEFQRAKDDETRTIWAGIAARLSAPAIAHGFAQVGAMVALALVAGLLVIAQTVHAQATPSLKERVAHFILCEIN
jgi:transcriptional regulator with XRE-family HTH domain